VFKNSGCLVRTKRGNGRFFITRALIRVNPGDSESCDQEKGPRYVTFWFII
jgi:hypothetical protein